MKKQFIPVLLVSVLAFGIFSSVLAEDSLKNSSSTEIRTRMDLRRDFEEQKNKLESQREQMRSEAEARKAEAEAKGDAARAQYEALKLEREAKREEMDAKREMMKKEAELRRASSTARRIEFQQDVAKRKVEHVTRVMNATISRLERIIERIESRIAKINEKGGDTTEAVSAIADAKVNLSDAQETVDAFGAINLSSDKASENFERIRTAAAEAREFIRAAHQNLRIAVRSLRAVEDDVSQENSGE